MLATCLVGDANQALECLSKQDDCASMSLKIVCPTSIWVLHKCFKMSVHAYNWNNKSISCLIEQYLVSVSHSLV